jgi:hypothetical protein
MKGIGGSSEASPFAAFRNIIMNYDNRDNEQNGK